jgi:hypothetical protein
MHGQLLSLTPIYLERDDHSMRLICLLEEFQEPTFTIIREGRHWRYHLTAFSAL